MTMVRELKLLIRSFLHLGREIHSQVSPVRRPSINKSRHPSTHGTPLLTMTALMAPSESPKPPSARTKMGMRRKTWQAANVWRSSSTNLSSLRNRRSVYLHISMMKGKARDRPYQIILVRSMVPSVASMTEGFALSQNTLPPLKARFQLPPLRRRLTTEDASTRTDPWGGAL